MLYTMYSINGIILIWNCVWRKVMGSEKSCGAVVYRKLGNKIEFLAVRSKANGHWSFPKGHMERGECEEETAKREVLEETGINIDLIDGFRTKMEYVIYKNIYKEVVYFIGEACNEDVKIQESEIQDYRWGTYNEMLRVITFDNAKKILKEVKFFLEGL